MKAEAAENTATEEDILAFLESQVRMESDGNISRRCCAVVK